MAEKGLTVRMKTDTSGFKKGMDEVVEKLNQYNKALVDNQYKQRECNKVINDAKKRIKELNETQKEKGKLDENEEKELKKLTETIEEEKVKLSQLRTEQASLRNVISETTRSLTDNNEKWTVLKGTLANLASDVLKKLAAQIVSIGKDVIQTGEQFSASMSEVGAISGATAEELAELEAAARLYGATTKFSATEAADALKYMALAGWNSQQAIAGLPAVLDLAAASGMDLGRASDIVTDYITAFGLEVEDASRFVDIMSYAMSNSNTTTEMLGEAYKNCAATAKSMGFSVEETTSALMTMANAGVKGGEAGTTLNTLMTRLATNTKGCADELAKYGVQIYDEQGKMHSLSEIMNGLISAFETLTQKEQANLSKMIAGTNQYAGFQTLMQGMSEKVKEAGMSFEDYTAALEQCEGTSNDMAKTMSNNLTGDLKTLESALDELKLKLFDSAETPLRNLVKYITTDGIAALDGIIKNLKGIIPVIVGAATAMGTLKASLAISTLITKLKTAFDGVTLSEIAATVATKGFKGALDALKADPVIALLSVFTTLVSVLGTVAAMNYDTADSYENASVKVKDYTENLRNLRQQEQESLEKIKAESQTLKDLQGEYDRLRQQTNLTADEKSQLDTVANELAKTLGISTQALRDKNGVYIEITGSIDEYIKKLEEQARLENATNGLKEAYTAYDKAKESCEEYSKKIEEQQEIVEDSHKHFENLAKISEEYNREHQIGLYNQNSESKRLAKEAKNAYEEFQNQQKSLDNLNDTWNQYYSQTVTATSAIIENKKAMGQAVDVDKEYEQRCENINIHSEKYGTIVSDITKKVEDNVKTTETATKKTETLSEKYKRLNGLLEENEQAIKDVNDEIEQAMDSGDTAHIEELQSKLKDLNSENATLKNRIKAVKDEIEKDANAIADAIENVENSMQMLQKAEKEVADNGKISLNTLMSIQKKYPELLDLVNDYVSGVKTEKDVIAGLKDVYEKDKVEFSNALTAKELMTKNYSRDYVNNTINLFNEIRDKYDIDVTNFKNSADAKQAINQKLYDEMLKKRAEYDKLNADKNYMVLHNIDRGQADYKEFEYFKYDNVQNTWRAATSAEIDYYKKVQQDFLNSVDNYYDFQNQSNFGDIYTTYLKNRRSANNLDNFIDTNVNSGNGSGKNDGEKHLVTLSGNGVTATGDTYAKAYMTWIDRMKALGKMSESSEIYHLEKLKERTDNTAEEIYQIDLKLYNARKKLADDNAKNLADIEKKNQDELQEKLNLAKVAYDRLVNGKIESLQKEAQAAKDTADAEIAALDKVLAKRKQAKSDEERQKKIDFINAQLRYKQLDDFSKNELQRQKQDLLNEQADIDFERNISAKQQAISQNASLAQNKTQQAIDGLNSAKSQFANHIAYLSGNQSYDQRVANNTVNQNIQIVQNSLSTDQLYRKFLKETGLI